jgi:hypothetical protein
LAAEAAKEAHQWASGGDWRRWADIYQIYPQDDYLAISQSLTEISAAEKDLAACDGRDDGTRGKSLKALHDRETEVEERIRLLSGDIAILWNGAAYGPAIAAWLKRQ